MAWTEWVMAVAGRPWRKRAGLARVVIVLVILVVPLMGAAAPAYGAQFRLPSRVAIRTGLEDAWYWLTRQHTPGLRFPVQESGTANGHPHEVPASAGRARRGTGDAPGKGAGQLPAYRVLPPKVVKGLSGHAVTGFNPRTSRWIAAKSTATSDYYQNADGTITRRFAEGPINFRDSAGAWQPIDTALVDEPDGRWAEKDNAIGVSFASAGSDTALTTVSLNADEVVSTEIAGAASVRPQTDGSRITYPDVLPGTDLVAWPTATGVKESLVLRDATAPTTWIYPLDLTGLRPVLAADGSVDLLDAAGKTAAMIPAAYAYDSKINPRSGEPATTHAVTYKLVTLNGKPALVVSLDPSWLHDPARVFPVTVDPSTLNASVVSTYAESGNPGDHSMEETMKVGSSNSGPDSAVSFLQFPATGLDDSKVTVDSATLSLFDVYASTCTAERFDVAAVTQNWTPDSVTSYPGPSYGASIGNATPTVAAACANTSVNPTVGNSVSVTLATSALQAWANGTSADYGLAIYAATTDSLHWKQFGSVYDPAGGPSLTITYTGYLLPSVSGQYPADQTVSNTVTPTLSASGKADYYRSNPEPEFDFQVYNAAGTKVADSGLVKAQSDPGYASWTVPSGDLSWGESYYWTVQAYDGTNYSTGPVWNTISIQVPQPAITSLLSQNTGNHGFDPSVGNYTTEATDADVATVGPSLTVVRDYNSLDPRTGGDLRLELG